MMRLPLFRQRVARTAAEAVDVLSGEPGSRPIAGGTDLLPNMKRGHQRPPTLVSLRRVPELHGIRGTPEAGVTIGAMTTLTEICRSEMLRSHYPGFVRAVASISTPTLRNMGTIGGNLCLDTRCTYYNQNEEWRTAIDNCMKCEGSICWVAPSSPRCWAISAADSVPVLCAMDAEVTVRSRAGERRMPVASLYREDGIRYLAIEPGELLVSLALPPASRTKATYWKLRRRGSIDFPVLGVGAAIAGDGSGRVREARIVLGAVSSAPLRAEKAEAFLAGKALDDATIAQAAQLARAVATPLDNTDFAMNWRARMSEVYVDGALRELAGLPAKARPPAHGAWAS